MSTVVADPPRFRRLKRWSLIGAIVAAALVGLRLWWGYEARRQIDAIVALAHARGERILPEDFNTGAVPENQNAAALFIAATTAIKCSPDERKWLDDLDGEIPLTAAD